MTSRHLRAIAAFGSLTLFALTACATTTEAPADDAGTPAAGDGHGEIAGARELAEPALHLTSVDPDGVIHHLDLLDEKTETLADIPPAERVVTDGRYLFAARDGSVTIVDSGVWTWSHIDHFHYYEAPARIVGEVAGTGTPTVVTGEAGTGILFEDEAVLVDTPALGDGEIVERFRVDVESPAGMLVPLHEGALLTEPGDDRAVTALRVLGADGEAGDAIECANAAGTITTVVGVVVGCADGAVLAVGGDPETIERIPYPAGADAPAADFAAREARPTVAALAGDTGFWLLDTRERAWLRHDVGEPLVRAVAVDDADGHVLLLSADGSVLVFAGGAVVARTAPLVAASLADPELAARVGFVVDQNRAYLNGPAEQALWEIDPADGARLARVFDTAYTPLHLSGTGR